MKRKYTSQARTALRLAEKAAAESGHPYIGTEHLLLGLLKEGRGAAAVVLGENGATEEKLTKLIDRLIAAPMSGSALIRPELTPRARAVLEAADRLAGEEKVGTEQLLQALLQTRDSVASRLLFTMDVQPQKLFHDLLRTLGISDEDIAAEMEAEGAASASEGQKTPALQLYGRDLTQAAAEHRLDPMIGREDELLRLMQVLSRRTKNNPCLIGEPGVGKTAIVEGLAQRIADDEVPEGLRNKRLIMLDLSAMVAGSKYRGEFEERIKKVIAEVTGSSDVMLFIDEIHTMIGAGGAEGSLDASNILKPALARGELQLIGATTVDEYRKHIEKDAALERRFQSILVNPPDEEEAMEIVRGLRPYYEKHHGVKISDDALEAAVRLGERYIQDRFLPDKAIDLMDETAARIQLASFGRRSGSTAGEDEREALDRELEEALIASDMERARFLQEKRRGLTSRPSSSARGRRGRVDAEAVAETLASWTGIPVSKLTESESRKLTRLEKDLHRRVVGQDAAVKLVSSAIRRGRVGLKDPGRPIGSFLFLGPTGVGKTELSKALASLVFGSEDSLIRIDMSEYMEKHSVSKIIGSPPGYVGYDEGGQLSEKIRRNPYSVILFDEIEKAHPDVFNILLQVLDDGHITDSRGRKVSFKETVIIMTSNAGAAEIVQPKKLGFLTEEDEKQDYLRMKSRVMEEVQRIFKPEFLNRIDEVMVFHSLTRENVREILHIQVKEFAGRARTRLGLELVITQAALSELLEIGYDPKYGARPLRRAIQEKLENPLAEKILSGEIRKNQKITIKCRNKDFFFLAQKNS